MKNRIMLVANYRRENGYMTEVESRDKITRVLALYTKLMNGAVIYKAEEAQNYGVTERSIQRDIDDVRNFMDEIEDNGGIYNSVVYDRELKGYRLQQIYDMKLTNPEVLAICKILLDSRSLTKKEMDSILTKLIDCCVPENDRKLVNALILNEKHHYIQPKHGKVFIQTMWDIGMAINEHRIIEFDYQGIQGHSPKHREVEPVAILNDGMYFYMVGFIRNIDKEVAFTDPDDANPTIYRIDRIRNFRVTAEHYHVLYKDRFEEGEFRKRIQFMFGGKLKKVRFRYKGDSIEAIEDKLPTAIITKESNRSYLVEVKVYGDGIDMWLKSQDKWVEIL